MPFTRIFRRYWMAGASNFYLKANAFGTALWTFTSGTGKHVSKSNSTTKSWFFGKMAF